LVLARIMYLILAGVSFKTLFLLPFPMSCRSGLVYKCQAFRTLQSDNSIDLLLVKLILYLRAKETGAIAINYMGNSFIEKKLKKSNFLTKYDDTIIMLYFANLPLESYLLNETN
jgi:hypothetical protein